jgi:hypothetical protein
MDHRVLASDIHPMTMGDSGELAASDVASVIDAASLEPASVVVASHQFPGEEEEVGRCRHQVAGLRVVSC